MTILYEQDYFFYANWCSDQGGELVVPATDQGLFETKTEIFNF
jgi:hypothetical protein